MEPTKTPKRTSDVNSFLSKARSAINKLIVKPIPQISAVP